MLRRGAARRLVGVRVVGSAADGALQAALASLFFLSPDRATTAGGIALASVVLTLPFTLVGPWVAPLLDRSSRRRTLVVGSLVRAVLALATAAAVATGSDVGVVVGVLAYLSVNRLLLAALSASLPRLVPGRDLVAANALVPTLGSAATLAGGGAALAAGAAGAPSWAVLAVVSAACLLAGAVAGGFARDRLGPDPLPVRTGGSCDPAGRADPDAPATRGRTVRGGGPGGRRLGAALAHLRSRPLPALALATLTAHRMAYGVVLVVALLSARNLLTTTTSDASLLLGAALGATGAGAALAAVCTPAAVRSLGSRGWTDVCCLLGAAVAVALVVSPHQATLVAGAAVLGVSAQGVKVATDAAVQAGVDDAFRGRVFVLYDLCSNLALITSTALAALVLPDVGRSVPVLVGAAAWWVALAVGHRAVGARLPEAPGPARSGPGPLGAARGRPGLRRRP